MKTTRLFGFLLVATFAFAPFEPAHSAVTENHYEETADVDALAEITVAQVAGPFEFPWSIACLPDGSLLVTERAGRLQLVKPGQRTSEITDLPIVLYHDHAGLLDVAVDPGFAENGTLYLSYVYGTTSSSWVRVLKARLDQQNLRLIEQQVIFESTPAAITQQFGGRIAVTGNGHPFFSPSETAGNANALRICRNISERSFAFAPMVLFRTTIHLFQCLVRNRKSGPMAIAIRKGSRSMFARTSYGHTSTGR